MEDIYITHVEIKNFQSHKETSLDFVKGTNALVGSSNSGKTAVLRAIRWCLINNPSGDSFITIGEKEAMVKVHLSNGKMIERRRDKGKVNLYRLYENGEVVDEFTGFGTKIPEPIVEAHGIVPIANDLYFQFADQLESAFMLSLKPKQRAEVLGNLEDLAKIDKALTGVNDDLRANSKNLKQIDKDGKTFQSEYEKLKVETDRMEGKVDALKALKEGINTKMQLHSYVKEQLSRLKEIQEITGALQSDLSKSDRIISKWPEDLETRIAYFKKQKTAVVRLKEIKEDLDSIQFMKAEKIQQLEDMKASIDEKVVKFNTLSRSLDSLRYNENEQEKTRNTFNDKIAALDIGPIDAEVGKYKILYGHLNQLRKIDQGIQETDELVKTATGKIDDLLDEFVKTLHEAELCPTCGQGTHEVCTETVETII